MTKHAKSAPPKRTRKATGKTKTQVAAPITPLYQWTHTGAEVLIVKCVAKDGSSYNGFKWPLTIGAIVEAPDWDGKAECGGGLHGWPWGMSIGDGKEPDWAGTWLVFGSLPADVLDLQGKVKVRRATIRFIGSWWETTAFVLSGQMGWVAHAAKDSSATGWRGAASATGGSALAAVTGMDGKVRAGIFGALALAWWNRSEKRSEMRCARTGIGDGSDGLLKAHQWYRLNEAGEFVESQA